MKLFTRIILFTGCLLISFISRSQPTAGFVINASSPVCDPATINFSNTSTGTAPLSYLWLFGDGTLTDTASNPVITTDTCGIFQIVLVVTDGDGLTDADTQSILIHCTPVSGFNVSDAIVCDSGDVAFTDASIPADSISVWLWDFGDPISGSANTSSLQNPEHHFAAQGLYTISLTVTSQSGCSDSQIDTVIVSDPVPFFTVNDSTPCAGDSVFFADASTSLDSVVGWAWNFDDPASGNNAASTQNAAHVFSEPGDYFPRLTIQTQGGCSGFYKNKITVLALPSVDAGTDQIICPADSVQLTAGGATDYQWSPGIYVSDSSISNPFAFPPITIPFFVTGTDINGCSNIDSVTVTVLPAPPANAGTDTSICAGTSATLHASGGISYLWSPNINISNDTIASPVVTPPSDITYNVTVTDEAGCTGVDSVMIAVAPPPAVTITSFDSSYCANGSTVELTGNPAGGLFSGDGVTGNLLNPSSLVIGGPYSIFYTYSDSIGCSGSDTASFTILNLPSVSISVTDSSVCLNGTPVEIIKSPPGGILSGAGTTDTVFDPTLLAAPGLYPVYYTVTDSAGCSNTDSINFLVLALPHINAGIDTAICKGDTIQLSGNGGISFLWLPDSSLSSSTDQNPLAFPDSTTMFLVTGTGINGCTAADSVLVTVISIASIDAGSNVAICIGDTAQLAASGGATYNWSPLDSLSDPQSDSTLAFPVATTTYTVSVNAGTSCPAIDSVTVTVNELPFVVASQDSTFCFGDSVQLSASGAISFSWQPDTSLTDFQIANPIAFPGTTTLYIVEGSDINNCSNFDSVLLTVLQLPLIDAGADSAICLGDSIQLVASGGEVYVWQPASTLSNDTIDSPIAFPDSTTLYFLTGTDNLGCSNTDSVKIVVLTASSIDAGNDTAICKGDTMSLHASGGLTYTWSPSLGLSDSTVADPQAFPDSTTTYTVTVSVGSDCIFSDSIVITVNALPVINAGTDTSICPGDSVQLFAAGGSTYEWSPAVSLTNAFISNPLAFPNAVTTYAVTGTDLNGCKSSDSLIISLLPSPVANAGADTALCLGDSVMLQATGGTSFQWTPSNTLTDATAANPIAFPATTTNYIVKVNDGGTCFGYDSVIIIVYPLPNADAGNDTTVCSGSTIQLNGSGGTGYSWSPTTGLSASTVSNPNALIDTSISYTLMVTDVNGCHDVDTIHLSVVPPLNASIGADTSICAGTTAQLFAAGGAAYSWFPPENLNNSTIPTPVASPDSTTTFYVIISDGICYSDTLSVNIGVSSPVINAGSDAVINPGEGYQLIASGTPGTYAWSPPEGLSCINCLNPVATPQQTTTYTLTVTDVLGCIAADEITLSTSCGEEVVYIPNAFTPNNNGKNDVLFVRSDGITKLNYFRIFDRWGTMVFESNDINDGWDGTYRSEVMSPGVYVYMAEVECGNGDVIRKEGNVTLLR